MLNEEKNSRLYTTRAMKLKKVTAQPSAQVTKLEEELDRLTVTLADHFARLALLMKKKTET